MSNHYVDGKTWICGIKGIITSSKGMMSLIVLGLSFTGLMMHRVDGTSFAMIIGTVATIFNITHSYVNGKQLDASKAAIQQITSKVENVITKI